VAKEAGSVCVLGRARDTAWVRKELIFILYFWDLSFGHLSPIRAFILRYIYWEVRSHCFVEYLDCTLSIVRLRGVRVV
jgi:hypothetical protein